MTRAFALLLASLSCAAPAAAQGRCHTSYTSGGERISERWWTFDAAGRVSRYAETLHPAAWSTTTTYRYDARGRRAQERLRIDEGPDEDEYGWHPPYSVQTERTADQVIERRPAHDHRPAEVVTWQLDRRGLPTSVHSVPGAEGSRDEVRYCAYDVEGRPIYMGLERDGREVRATRWSWSGGRLTRIAQSFPERDEVVLEVRHPRRDRVEIVTEDGEEIDTWEGRCEAVLYDLCSPILGPARADGTRPRAPRVDGPLDRPTTARDVTAFDAALLRAPLTLARIRGAYAGRAVHTDVGFYESSPNVPYPIVCVGGPGNDCATVIVHDDRRRATSVTTTDPSLEGPAGIRVGAAGSAIAEHLEACVVERGLEVGIECRARGRPEVAVWLDAPEEVLRAPGDVPSAEVIAGRHVERLAWTPTPRERE
ncbi:MAG: hypothetical protein H6719_18815 [Sandaracinaceae bacterium]|nr:hypothetical protein [Sandaracinaceae bacterium]